MNRKVRAGSIPAPATKPSQMKLGDYKALYRAWREIKTMCQEAGVDLNNSNDDRKELMRSRLQGLLEAKSAVEWILMTKNKK